MAETEKPNGDLEWTGERYIPGIEGDVAVEHLHRYALARELVHGKDVLDIACGEGYGASLLIEVARSVIGVDVARDVVDHARDRYVQPGLRFEVGSCDDIPVEDNSVDVVVSFETIEHHDRHVEMLTEIKRVLRPNGLLIISSPDKHEYSEVPGNANPFHVKELYLNEFKALLQSQFRNIALYGQRIHYGSAIAPMDAGAVAPWYTFTGEAGNINGVAGVERPLYFIALATDGTLTPLQSGMFADPKSVWRRDQQIAALEHSVASAVQEWEGKYNSAENTAKLWQERHVSAEARAAEWQNKYDTAETQLEALSKEIAQTQAQVETKQHALDQLQGRTKDLELSIAQLDDLLLKLTDEIEGLKAELAAQRELQELYAAETERWQHEYGSKQEDLRAQAQTIDLLQQRLVLEEHTSTVLKAAQQQLERDRAELQGLVRALVESASWRITGPLRQGKKVAVGLSKFPRRLAGRGERLLLQLWRMAPIPRDSKVALKSFLFGHFPDLFGDTLAYRAWLSTHTKQAEACVATTLEQASQTDRFANVSISFPDVSEPLVSVIVTVFNKLDYTLACLTSIQTHMPTCSFEIVLVDDGSTDETEEVTRRISGLRYVRNSSNLGFLRSANRGASMARGKYLYFLNNDTEVQNGSIDNLLEVFTQVPGTAVAGSKLVYPAGHLQEAGAVLNTDGTVELVGLNGSPDAAQFNFLREVDYCSGASMMIDRERFESLGGFDDSFAPAYFEDADLSLRIRKSGARIMYQPASCVVHHLSVTTNDYGPGKLALIEQNKRKFLDRWQHVLNEDNRVRLIAFYLPQFHPIPENDAWWGAGFTEWSNVTKARPNFDGHYQPHVPGSLGYYDLGTPEAREAQAALARSHGIHGFCYYYYWFGGKKLLERPLSDVVKSGEPRFPFCVCWANETWSRRWDGRDSDVLMEQTYSPEDDVAFIESLLPLFSDERYIRIHGRPLLLIYRADKLPNAKCTVERWRQVCAKAGIPDPYLVRVCSFGGLFDQHEPRDFGFDAAVEFPPHGLAAHANKPAGTVSEFHGGFYDYIETAKRFRTNAIPPYRLFKSVMPAWDNTARRQHGAHIFLNSDPVAYEGWLRDAIETTRRFAVGEERIVFINAWNEWAEGNHLEPDIHYGHGYLNATKRAWEAACGLKLPDGEAVEPAQVPLA